MNQRRSQRLPNIPGRSYQNTKKHLDRLIGTCLVQRGAGFGRETDRGIAPVWKYSIAERGLENLTLTLGVFSSIATPLGYNDIRERIRAVQSALSENGEMAGPVLYVIGGSADGTAFILKKDRILMGREDPDHPPSCDEGNVILPDEYRSVTRVTKPHAFLIRTGESWQIEDNASTGGTFVNSRRLDSLKRVVLAYGDVIDLSVGVTPHGFCLYLMSEGMKEENRRKTPRCLPSLCCAGNYYFPVRFDAVGHGRAGCGSFPNHGE